MGVKMPIKGVDLLEMTYKHDFLTHESQLSWMYPNDSWDNDKTSYPDSSLESL